MATIKKEDAAPILQGGTWGNVSVAHITFVPDAATTAGDVVQLAVLPAGTKLLDAIAFVEDAVASLTLKLGFNYIDSAATGDDDDCLFASTNVAAGGKFRADAAVPPLTLKKDAYLIATLGGAAFATTNKLDVVVFYDFTGPQ